MWYAGCCCGKTCKHVYAYFFTALGYIQFAFTEVQPANSCQDVYRWTDTTSVKHTSVWSCKLVRTRGECSCDSGINIIIVSFFVQLAFFPGSIAYSVWLLHRIHWRQGWQVFATGWKNIFFYGKQNCPLPTKTSFFPPVGKKSQAKSFSNWKWGIFSRMWLIVANIALHCQLRWSLNII